MINDNSKINEIKRRISLAKQMFEKEKATLTNRNLRVKKREKALSRLTSGAFYFMT